jgi:hypothetical protein
LQEGLKKLILRFKILNKTYFGLIFVGCHSLIAGV